MSMSMGSTTSHCPRVRLQAEPAAQIDHLQRCSHEHQELYPSTLDTHMHTPPRSSRSSLSSPGSIDGSSYICETAPLTKRQSRTQTVDDIVRNASHVPSLPLSDSTSSFLPGVRCRSPSAPTGDCDGSFDFAGMGASDQSFDEDDPMDHDSLDFLEPAPSSSTQDQAPPSPPLEAQQDLSPCLLPYSDRFPPDYPLHSAFASQYNLGDELGAGGFGFVMTARHCAGGPEVAVKFIIKEKIPVYAYLDDPVMGRIPTEIFLLAALDHENIVKCIDLFEDEYYYIMIQELHGSPWEEHEDVFCEELTMSPADSDVPELSPSTSVMTIESAPPSPSTAPLSLFASSELHNSQEGAPDPPEAQDSHCFDEPAGSDTLCLPKVARPCAPRRASHDLFEFIETSQEKRLSEDNARPVFAQVVEAVDYLDSMGVAHRDLKDENILIDKSGKVKLIDFGSASVADPTKPRPYYDSFFGTTAYAASEILQKKRYQAAPAEVWTLGVLLSYLLTGASPFPTQKDAIRGRIKLTDIPGVHISRSARNLLRRCLESDPKKRATIAEVRDHPWLVKH